MSLSFVLINLNDANFSIQYSGPWFKVENRQINREYMDPFQDTLHSTASMSLHTFLFRSGRSGIRSRLLLLSVRALSLLLFSGSAVLVYGKV